MKKLGYKTHLVGKWHLGAGYRNATPTLRGFDTHFGYWNGYLGYYNYMVSSNLNFEVKTIFNHPFQMVIILFLLGFRYA